MSEKVNSGWRRVIARIVICSLAIQAAVTAFMLPAPIEGQRLALAAMAASPGSIVYCSPTGLRQITFDQDGVPVESPLPGAPEQCPVCMALAGVSTAVLPSVDPTPPISAPAQAFLWPGDESRLPGASLRSLNNRGPPVRV